MTNLHALVSWINSGGLMVALIVQYVLISVVALFERRWSLSLYYAGAGIISIAVLAMRSSIKPGS